MLSLTGGRRLIPTAAPAIAAAQWTYVAELLAAGRRQHRQLAIYLSINLDPGRVRFQRTKGLVFEPELRPEPVARGQYGRAFLAQVRQSLEAIRGGPVRPDSQGGPMDRRNEGGRAEDHPQHARASAAVGGGHRGRR